MHKMEGLVMSNPGSFASAWTRHCTSGGGAWDAAQAKMKLLLSQAMEAGA